MLRAFALALFLAPAFLFAANPTGSTPASTPPITGVVSDPTGAIVPGAAIDLLDENGTTAGSFHSDGEGAFQVVPPHPGNFTLVISEPGFETIKTPVVIAAPAAAAAVSGAMRPFAAPLRIVLPIPPLSTSSR